MNPFPMGRFIKPRASIAHVSCEKELVTKEARITSISS